MLDLSPQDWIAVALWLRIALVATLVALPFGIAIATLLARKSFWGKSLLDAVVHLPLVLPPVVAGYLLLIPLGRKALVGAFLADHFGIVFSFRWTGAALACGVMAFPLLVRAIRLSIEAIDRRLEGAAATLGANRAWLFLTVTLPLALPGIIAGMMLAFARALGEFGATITFVSNIPGETQTISAAIYTLTQVPGGDAAALSLVIVAVIISLAALVASEWFARRASARLHGASIMLAVDVEKKLGDFAVAATFVSETGTTVLFGPSGAGKTTVVNMIAGLLRPDRGRIVLDDQVLFDDVAGVDVPAVGPALGWGVGGGGGL